MGIMLVRHTHTHTQSIYTHMYTIVINQENILFKLPSYVDIIIRRNFEYYNSVKLYTIFFRKVTSHEIEVVKCKTMQVPKTFFIFLYSSRFGLSYLLYNANGFYCTCLEYHYLSSFHFFAFKILIYLSIPVSIYSIVTIPAFTYF